MRLEELTPGDSVYTYHDSVALGAELVPLVVVRVNRVSVTVRSEHGTVTRMNPAELIDFYKGDER